MGYDVKVNEVHGMAPAGRKRSKPGQVWGKGICSGIKMGDADILLAFEKIEAARWLDYLKPDGMVIINDEKVDSLPVMSGKAKYPDTIHEKIAA
jgi:indolepyruvate ferredoxin oxidoreductase beta subunit